MPAISVILSKSASQWQHGYYSCHCALYISTVEVCILFSYRFKGDFYVHFQFSVSIHWLNMCFILPGKKAVLAPLPLSQLSSNWRFLYIYIILFFFLLFFHLLLYLKLWLTPWSVFMCILYVTSCMCVTVGIYCPLEGMQTSFISTVTASLSALPPFLTSVNSSLHRDWPGAVLGLPAVWAEPGVGGECNGEDRARVGQRLSYVRVLLGASATLLSRAGVINTGVSS